MFYIFIDKTWCVSVDLPKFYLTCWLYRRVEAGIRMLPWITATDTPTSGPASQEHFRTTRKPDIQELSQERRTVWQVLRAWAPHPSRSSKRDFSKIHTVQWYSSSNKYALRSFKATIENFRFWDPPLPKPQELRQHLENYSQVRQDRAVLPA